MALFYLVRHGEPAYDVVARMGFRGLGRNFAPLTENGVAQAQKAAQDARLADADVIIASPYTRALQTAAIIAAKTGVKLVVEPDLHEWIEDLGNETASGEEAAALYREFVACNGVCPEGKTVKWETLRTMRDRVKAVADRYAEAGYQKVVIVSHGMALRTLKYIEEMAPGEIVACEYEKGQAEDAYYFA